MPARLRSLAPRAAALAAALLAAGCGGLDPGNPLIGRWTLTAPVGTGFSLGTYEFERGSMRMLGIEQPVEYSVSDGTVLVVPQGFGPTLEIEIVDRNTARLRDPVTGTPLTLRRLR